MSPLAQLYALSARRRLRLTHWCPCCTTPEEMAALKAAPVRELPWTVLKPLLSCTVGDDDDFLVCLPRLLELTPLDSFDRQRLLRRLERARATPEEDRTVRAWLREELLEALDVAPPGELLSAIVTLDLSAQVLARLDVPLAPVWYAQLAWEIGCRRCGGLTEQESVFIDAILSEPRLESLERAFFAAVDPEEQRLFSSAVQVLEWLVC